METLSQTEENYIKTIFHIQNEKEGDVSTNDIAESLNTSAASVSDMIKKLSSKKHINYVKYKGVTLTNKGKSQAITIIRKHRLWEVFLVQKLQFNWDEVHDVAEELEHIQSPLLIKRLDDFLGFPKHDPHGDPIPNEKGEMDRSPKILLIDFAINKESSVIGVKDSDTKFLQYLDKIGISIGCRIKIEEKIEYDESLEISINDTKKCVISKEVSKNIYVN